MVNVDLYSASSWTHL